MNSIVDGYFETISSQWVISMARASILKISFSQLSMRRKLEMAEQDSRLKALTTRNATGEANWINTWARSVNNLLLLMVK